MVFRSGLGQFTTVKDEVMVKITLYNANHQFQSTNVSILGFLGVLQVKLVPTFFIHKSY